MNVDGRMALAILYRMTKEGVPCLGVHDSFIVPQHAESLLITTMIKEYYRVTGYTPFITH